MIVTIHQPQFLPWLGYFDKIRRADTFILLDNTQYKKNEWQNRNRIKIHDGWQWLTVPVIHNFGQLIMEVKINNCVDWKRKHINALKLNYSKAPFFNEYFPGIEAIYDQPWTNLCDINIAFIDQIVSWLNLDIDIVKASDFDVIEDGTLRLVELCKSLGSKKYLSGAGGNSYLDFELFKQNGVEVIIQDYQHPVYQQTFSQNVKSDFESNLSIVDLLFNCGHHSLSVLSGENIVNQEII